MQLVNASSPNIGGGLVPLSANTSWSYPNLPGEPPSVLRQRFAACIPSNITIASACCAAANGTFVLPTLNNSRLFTAAELTTILNAKYPNRNNSAPGIGGAPMINGSYYTNNLTATTNVTTSGPNGNQFNWCSLSYDPLTSIPLNNLTINGFQSGPYYGYTPESINKWISCFNSSTTEADRAAQRAVYVCVVDDVREGGTINGFTRYNVMSGAESAVGVKGMGMVFMITVLGMLLGGYGHLLAVIVGV